MTGGAGEIVLPQVIVDAGPQATARFLEFFAGRIKQRAAAAGLPPATCSHTFRATGITAYLSNGGDARALGRRVPRDLLRRRARRRTLLRVLQDGEIQRLG